MPAAFEILSSDVLAKLREFCTRYFNGKPTSKQKKELSQQFNEYVLTVYGQLCNRLNTDVLDKEPNVVAVKGLSFVFGDIHGNLEDLFYIETTFCKRTDSNYLFLGDFVDRGAFSVEVSLYLLALKLSEPHRFILVRGNHEVRAVNKCYTFYTECLSKFGTVKGHHIWDQINSCFDRLPFAATIDDEVFCCHGGVPSSISTVGEMLTIGKPLIDPELESPVVHEMLWNDPVETMPNYSSAEERRIKQKDIEFLPNKARSTGFYYTALAVKKFLDKNGMTHMIRAHQCVDAGHMFTSDDKVVTVFSSSNYCGKNNKTCCVKVNNHLIQVCTMKNPK